MILLIFIAVVVLLNQHDKYLNNIANQWYEGTGND